MTDDSAPAPSPASTPVPAPAGFDPVAAARRLMREARSAALATLDAGGAPYVSLVTVAGLPDGAPVLLLSNLARHTRNLKADPRACLLFDERRPDSALEGARLSLTGTVVAATAEEAAPRRFLARHPEAAGYAAFADFAFYRLEPEGGHLVAGFGRIVDLDWADIVVETASCAELLAAEEGAVSHMNEDHADAVARYATRLLGAPEGSWRLIGIDPEGCDLMAAGTVRRLDFPRRLASAHEMHMMMVELARQTRA